MAWGETPAERRARIAKDRAELRALRKQLDDLKKEQRQKIPRRKRTEEPDFYCLECKGDGKRGKRGCGTCGTHK